MKNIIIVIVIMLIKPICLPANDGKYLEAMQKNIQAIYDAKEIHDLQKAVNAFERVASAENSKWEPLYYMAFGNIMMANLEHELSRRDSYLDLAMAALKKAHVISPQESEIIALEGFIHMMRITVDPQSRGMVYAPQAMHAYEEALSLNPENPRALGLLAQMQYGTAEFFGSSTAEACALNAKASEKIQSYKSGNPLAPVWGNSMIESLQEKCK